MNEIKLIQEPKIKHELSKIGASVVERINALDLDKQVATEDTIKTLKTTRTTLNKEFNEYEEQRKSIKKAVAAPYSEMEVIYKAEITERYSNAINLLKDKIATFEDKVKEDKKEDVRSYFAEKCLDSDIDFLVFDKLDIKIDLSTSLKKYRDNIDALISKTVDELELIKTQEFEADILIEYKTSRNVALAIKTVLDRKAAVKAEAQKLLDQRTTQRESQLRSIAMVYSDMTRTFNYVSNPSIIIAHKDILELSDSDFTVKLVEIKASIKAITPKATNTVSAPVKAPTKTITVPANKPEAHIESPIQASAPKAEEKAEAIYTATFQVRGTFSKLTALKEFLVNNTYDYKNID